MHSLPQLPTTIAFSSQTALLVVVAGGLLVVLIAFVSFRHAISRRLLARLDAIRLAMQQLDRERTLLLLQRTEKLLGTWDWLLNEHDQCGARRLIDEAERVYAS